MKIAFIEDGIYAYASGSPLAVGGAERDQWLLARALARAEGFPNTFAQAWLAGTPVVSLKVAPVRVIVENNLGVVTGSAERAVAEIKALIESPDRRQQIGICAHNYGLKNYSAATVVKLFEDALVNNRV